MAIVDIVMGYLVTLTAPCDAAVGGGGPTGAAGRGLHWSTFRLNVSTFCGIRWMHDFLPVYYTGGYEEV